MTVYFKTGRDFLFPVEWVHYIPILQGGRSMEKIKTFDELTIRDNFRFQHVMRNERLCTHLIEKILDIKVRSLRY